jgi:hypothetical protein
VNGVCVWLRAPAGEVVWLCAARATGEVQGAMQGAFMNVHGPWRQRRVEGEHTLSHLTELGTLLLWSPFI